MYKLYLTCLPLLDKFLPLKSRSCKNSSLSQRCQQFRILRKNPVFTLFIPLFRFVTRKFRCVIINSEEKIVA